MLGLMEERDARAPSPRRGDPHAKSVQLELTAEEWRKLRVLAAGDAISVEQALVRILRHALSELPGSRY